jgi:hypothetical protein
MTRDYYGTKRITAWPEDKTIELMDPNQPEKYYRVEKGYAVKYADGYTSWSPKGVFEKAYQSLDKLSFGHAIVALKEGLKVARSGWNGKGMWLELSEYGKDAMYKTRPMHQHILMATAQGDYVPWLASQTDMLADDWQIVD